MTTKSKRPGLAWKIMLLPCFILMIPSTLQFFVPGLYVGIYLEGLAGMTPEQVIALNPALFEVMKLGFRGIGFTVIGLLIVSISVLLIAFRGGEKWVWISLMCTWTFLWVTNLVLEAQSGGGMVWVLYSIVALVLLFVGGFLAYGDTFKKSSESVDSQ